MHAVVDQASSKKGWVIPRIALRESERGQWSCLIAIPDGDEFRVGVRLVQVIHVTENNALITGALQAGDLLITGGLQHLLPGMALNLQVGE